MLMRRGDGDEVEVEDFICVNFYYHQHQFLDQWSHERAFFC